MPSRASSSPTGPSSFRQHTLTLNRLRSMLRARSLTTVSAPPMPRPVVTRRMFTLGVSARSAVARLGGSIGIERKRLASKVLHDELHVEPEPLPEWQLTRPGRLRPEKVEDLGRRREPVVPAAKSLPAEKLPAHPEENDLTCIAVQSADDSTRSIEGGHTVDGGPHLRQPLHRRRPAHELVMQ